MLILQFKCQYLFVKSVQKSLPICRLQYWKDAVYGSLAGFNAAFMKAVLKNLVPQDVALQAIETRQLRIFDWLSRLMAEE